MKKKYWIQLAVVAVVVMAGIIFAPYLSFFSYAIRTQASLRDKGFRNLYLEVYRHPENTAARSELAYRQTGLGDYKSAEKNYQKVLEKSSKDDFSLTGLVDLYKQQKQYGRAEDYAKKFIEDYPSQDKGYNLLLELYSFFDTQKGEQVPELARQAFAKTSNPQFLLVSAGYYEKTGNFKEAADALRQWLSLSQNSGSKDRPVMEAWLQDLQTKVK